MFAVDDNRMRRTKETGSAGFRKKRASSPERIPRGPIRGRQFSCRPSDPSTPEYGRRDATEQAMMVANFIIPILLMLSQGFPNSATQPQVQDKHCICIPMLQQGESSLRSPSSWIKCILVTLLDLYNKIHISFVLCSPP